MTERLVLPQGEILRDFLAQAAIGRSDLRKIVRRRGIFLRSDDKGETIPSLVRTGLTPTEFQFLLSLLEKNEDNPKFSSQIIQDANDITSLSEAVDDHCNFSSVLDTSFKNYRMSGTPMVVAVDGNPNVIEMAFKIVRRDYSKSFTKIDAEFEGKVFASKNPTTNEINIISTHTSKETRKICDEIASEFISGLKIAGVVANDAKAVSVRFSDFSSEGRFKFLQSLASDKSSKFIKFQAIGDVGFKPNSQTDKPLELAWLEDNLSSVRFRGVGLEKLRLLSQEAHHAHIETYRIEADYEFSFDAINGTCTITFDFPDYSQSGDVNSELVITIADIQIFETDAVQLKAKQPSKTISEKIRSALDFSKAKLHKQYSRKALGRTENKTPEPTN
ncbi:hypothetical protein ACLNGM_10820 [Aureimonas phyllosphaerae]|uniref:GapS4b family protein n=1 Tax=Aureimonas phyllosphaerae TaxID=1166078 RepID=UPI003A5BCC75